jgi:hypothetical protein
MGRERTEVRWITSEVFTSDDFSRLSQEAYHRKRISVFGVHRCFSEGGEEGPARHSYGARVSRCLLNKLFLACFPRLICI